MRLRVEFRPPPPLFVGPPAPGGDPGVNAARAVVVTAVIPAHNAERFLAEAVESVLGQTHASIECVVVDDGSTDSTLEVASAFADRIRVVQQSNAGVAAARNAGAAVASSDLLAFLDADDRWQPRRVERQVQALRVQRAEAALCASRVFRHDGYLDEVITMHPLPPTLESLLLWEGRIVSPGSNLLVERRTFEEIGGFDPRLSTAADWELLARLVGRGRLTYVDEPLVDKRWHAENMSRDVVATEHDLRRAYRLLIDREGDRLGVSRRQAWAGFHRMLAVANLSAGRTGPALAHGARAAWRDPIRVPGGLVRMLRSRAGQRSSVFDS